MDIRVKFSVRIFLIVCVFLCNSVCSFAFENSLLGIDVKQNSSGNYNILLKLDRSVKIQKNINSNDNMTLILNSTLPSESLEIIYDNTSEISNVVVQKKNNENTLILLQGKNISNANIETKELLTGKTKQTTLNNDSGFLYIADKKILSASVLIGIFLFIFMLFARPKKKRYYSNNTYNTLATKNKADTLRNKNLIQSKKIPSINYNISERYKNLRNVYMTNPNEYNSEISTIENNKIKKAG